MEREDGPLPPVSRPPSLTCCVPAPAVPELLCTGCLSAQDTPAAESQARSSAPQGALPDRPARVPSRCLATRSSAVSSSWHSLVPEPQASSLAPAPECERCEVRHTSPAVGPVSQCLDQAPSAEMNEGATNPVSRAASPLPAKARPRTHSLAALSFQAADTRPEAPWRERAFGPSTVLCGLKVIRRR